MFGRFALITFCFNILEISGVVNDYELQPMAVEEIENFLQQSDYGEEGDKQMVRKNIKFFTVKIKISRLSCLT